MSEPAHQPTDEKLESCRQYLLALGADKLLHSGRHFLAHLEGTYRLLRSWGLSEPVCHAGLFHSMYGTDGFKRNALTLDDRHEVRALIGEEAERLVYLFCSIRRISMFERGAPQSIRFREAARRTPISKDDWVALLHIEYANTLDQCLDLGFLGKFVLTKLGRKWLHLKQHLSAGCNAELAPVFASHKISKWQYSAFQPLFWVLQRL
jgi:hypothetical protein